MKHTTFTRIFLIVLLTGCAKCFALDSLSYISFDHVEGGFSLASGGKATPLVVSEGEEAGVIRGP